MLLAVAYVSLPWWAPTDLIRRHLTEQMSSQLGLDVNIGEISLSWDQGIALHDFQIASPEGFSIDDPGVAMVHASVIRAELSPINLFWRKRIAWMEIESPVVNLEVDAEGNFNAKALSALKFDVETDSTSVRDATINIQLPEHDKKLVLGVQDMQLIDGRLKRIERVTMSAELRQKGSSAQIALAFDDTVKGATPIEATACFNFSNVDLQQLDLVRLLDLPLRKFAGRSSGSLSIRANGDGEIDHVEFNLIMRQLDLQPLDKRIKLPIIAEAGFRVSASYDPVNGRVKLDPFSVRLPGLDMSGTGTLFNETLSGNWQGIRHLEMRGLIQPTQLISMLTGTSQLPGDLSISGPVAVQLNWDHDGNVLACNGSIDAASAEIRHLDRLVKPLKQKFKVEIKTALDERTFGLNVSHWRIWLGDNIFTGQGAVRDLRKLLVTGDDGLPVAALNIISNWQWKGQAELHELDSLRSLNPVIAETLSGVSLKGQLIGEITVDSRDGLIAQGSLSMPQGASLTRGDQVLKSPGQAVRLSARASANRKSAGIDDMEFRLTVGKGRLVLDRGRVRFIAADAKTKTSAQIDISGEFQAGRVEDLLAGLKPGGIDGIDVLGSMRGKYAVRISPDAHRLHITATDTETLDFRAGNIFAKPAGVKAALSLDFLSDYRVSSSLGNILRCSLRQQKADVRAEISFGADNDKPEVAMLFRADIRDARWLAKSIPLAGEALGSGRLSGAAVLNASGHWRPGRIETRISCDADAIAYNSHDSSKRRKRAGIPLRFSLAGNVTTTDDLHLSAAIKEMTLTCGQSYARVIGDADLVARKPKLVTIGSWVEVLPRCGLKFNGRLAVDGALVDLAPELRAQVKQFALGGYAKFDASLDASKNGLTLKCNFNADQATFTVDNEFVKPLGAPAEVIVQTTLSPDFSKVVLNDFQGNVGDVHVLAGGSLAPLYEAGRWRVEPKKLRFTVSTRRAATLDKMIAKLKPYKLAGDVILEGQWSGGWSGSASSVSLQSKSLTGQWRGKKVKIAGDLLVRDVARRSDGNWSPDSLRTKNFQIQAGKNNVWLLANLKGLHRSPAGSITLLGRYLDTRDLTKWLTPLKPTTRPAILPTTLPTTRKKEDTPRERAEKIIASCVPLLRSSDIIFSLQAAHLRLWDDNVSQYYDLLDMKLKASLTQGLIVTNYACGLNGGSIRGGVQVNLKDPSPAGKDVDVEVWQDIRDVAARENVKPQLALFFPGNIVSGMFNRRQDVKFSLVDFVASSFDPSVKVNPVGKAKTVTIDGITQGRAAPKFVTALFPGLNMTSYQYEKMTAFSEMHADGGAYSDMIFNGKVYDLYMEGVTDSKKIGKYDIGLILVGTPQTPEWNHVWRQGRLPLLKIKARIEGGKMHDVEVSYPWPNESLGVIFVKNNIFYRAYLASKGK